MVYYLGVLKVFLDANVSWDEEGTSTVQFVCYGNMSKKSYSSSRCLDFFPFYFKINWLWLTRSNSISVREHFKELPLRLKPDKTIQPTSVNDTNVNHYHSCNAKGTLFTLDVLNNWEKTRKLYGARKKFAVFKEPNVSLGLLTNS